MFKVVKIVWTDALAIGEWKTQKDLEADSEKDSAPCISIGFLIKSNKQFYYVANTISSGDTQEDIMSNGIMMIPKKWVTSFDVLLEETDV